MSYHPFMDVSTLSTVKATRAFQCRMYGRQSSSRELRLRHGPLSHGEGIRHPSRMGIINPQGSSTLPSSPSHNHLVHGKNPVNYIDQANKPRRNSELGFALYEESQFDLVESFIDTAEHHHDIPMESQSGLSSKPWFPRRVFQAYERVWESPPSFTIQSKTPFLCATRDRSLAASKLPLCTMPSSPRPIQRRGNGLCFESRSSHAGLSLPTKANTSRHQSRGYSGTCSEGSSVCSASLPFVRQLHGAGLEIMHGAGSTTPVVHLFSQPPPHGRLVPDPLARRTVTRCVSVGNAGLSKRQLKRRNRRERLERLGLCFGKSLIQSKKSDVVCYFRHGKMSFTSKSLEKEHSRMRAKIRQAIASGVLAEEVDAMHLEYKTMKEEYHRLICAAKQEFLKNLDARGSVEDVTKYVVDNLLHQVGYFVRSELKRDAVELQRCPEETSGSCDAKALGMSGRYGSLDIEGPQDLALVTNSTSESSAGSSVVHGAADYCVDTKAVSRSHVTETTACNSTQSVETYSGGSLESNRATGGSTCLALRMPTDKSASLATGPIEKEIYGSQSPYTARTSVGSELYQGELTYEEFSRQAHSMKLPDEEDMRLIRTMFVCSQPHSHSTLVPSPQVIEGRGS